MSQGYTKGIPIDTDPQLSLDSDFLVPSQKAVKSYVEAYQGSANNSAALGGIPAASYALKIDVSPAFDKANTANITADLAYGAANVAQNTAVAAFGTANAAGIIAIAGVDAANIAQNTAVAAFGVANTVNVTSVAAFGVANTANVTSVAAFGAANTAQYTANLAFDTANAAFGAANNAVTDFSPAFIAANTAQYTANLAFDTANVAYGQANTATTNAGTAQGTAVAAFGVANTANVTSVAAFGQANTATTNAGTAQSTADAAFGQANTAQSTGVAAFGVANTANVTSVAAFGAANTAQSTAVSAFAEANTAESIAIAAFGQANTAQSTGVAAFGTANTAQSTAVAAFAEANTAESIAIAAFGTANTAQSTAVAAFGVANAALPAIGGTISGDLIVTGNATFSGETTYANTTHLNIGDSILTLNADLPFDQPPTEDAGILVNRGNLDVAEILWDEAVNKWTFDDGTNIHRIIASNTDVETVSAAAIGAFAKANNAQLDATSAFGAANTAKETAVSAFDAANTAQSIGVAAFGVANTALANTSGVSFNGNFNVPSGNVGIGTTTPTEELEVNGTILANNGDIVIKNANTQAVLYLDSPRSNNKVIAFRAGTATPNNRWVMGVDDTLEATGSNGSNFFLNRYANAGTYLDTVLYADRNTGNVGIGIIGATQKLHVRGSALITGNLIVSGNNTSGYGIILSDDGDIVDLNDGYASMRFSSGVKVYSTKSGGNAVITLTNTGQVNATAFGVSGGAFISQNVSGGFTVTAYSLGTGSGTVTPSGLNGNYQYITNNGAFTLAAPTVDSAIDILVTNGASAGTITFSGFTVGSATGSAYATTNAQKYLLSIRRINGTSTYSWYALQ